MPFGEVSGVFIERPVAGGDVDEGEDGFVGHAFERARLVAKANSGGARQVDAGNFGP